MFRRSLSALRALPDAASRRSADSAHDVMTTPAFERSGHSHHYDDRPVITTRCRYVHPELGPRQITRNHRPGNSPILPDISTLLTHRTDVDTQVTRPVKQRPVGQIDGQAVCHPNLLRQCRFHFTYWQSRIMPRHPKQFMALYKGIFWKWTMCWKFQLTISAHPTTVANATCSASSEYFGVTILACR